jgi:2-polyprenyl-6-methoxyphenol hydroxylase-like FAD-dependent oxidoreductase
VVCLFNELVNAGPSGDGPIVFDTACVLGGSVAGLLAARVLSDHARRVVIVERDEFSTAGRSRPGVPQDQQVHTLLPAGRLGIERWLPGFTQEAQDLGAVMAGTDTTLTAFDGRPLARSGGQYHLLAASRPFLEARIRARVVDLPNVSALHARATGLQYDGAAVSAVRYIDKDVEAVLAADFVVDAMGRSSRLSDWVRQLGYEQPRLERLAAPINYATAVFERRTKSADLDVACALTVFTPEHAVDGVSVAAASAIEGGQWLVLLMGYGQDRPGRTLDEFRTVCAKLPAIFGEATLGAVTRDVVTYHQAESRRRDFTALRHFPAGLVSVGDAVASFNPIYGQGMSSAVLHASCLSSYLTSSPEFNSAATDFFRLQQVVVDAAWAVSAGGDAARLDAANGVEVPDEVRHQRWALQQVMTAALLDGNIAQAFKEVSYMLQHPATLADPALLDKAVAINGATPTRTKAR